MITLLLGDRSPALRRRVLLELAGASADDPEVDELTSLVDEEAKRVVGVPARSTRDLGWKLCRLAHLGLRRGHPAVDETARDLYALQRKDGSWPLPRDGGEEGYTMSPLQTALPLRGLAAAGLAEDERSEAAFEWLLEKRLPDGSWPTGTAGGTTARVAGYRKLPRSAGCRTNTTGALACLALHPTRRSSLPAAMAADVLLRKETREEATFGYEVARLCGVEAAAGHVTFYARLDIAFLLDIVSRVAVDADDQSLAGLVDEIVGRRNPSGLWLHPVYPHLSRWLTLDLTSALDRLGRDR